MNCAGWEERIALYAGGDLPAEAAGEVQRHLRDCPACRLFASGLQESLELVRAAHDEQIAPAHFAAVRARVLAELANARHPWWRKSWIYGLGAAAALWVVWTVLPTALLQPVQHLPTLVRTPPAPRIAAPAPSLVKARSSVRRKVPVRPALRKGNSRPTPGPPIVVKLVTDDPDVVIYWITDNSGE